MLRLRVPRTLRLQSVGPASQTQLVEHRRPRFLHPCEDSNPDCTVLETGILPLEHRDIVVAVPPDDTFNPYREGNHRTATRLRTEDGGVRNHCFAD